MALHRRLATALGTTVVAAVLVLAATPGASRAASGPPGPGVAWQAAAADADVERAFAQARAARKPVLLYWGASWCPPCNQLKATLFNRQDFIERAQGFVAVHVDGDGAGAQKLGARFKVRGYPTMILFAPDGQEITRLPGEVDAPQVLQVLGLAMANGRPVKAVLADARAGRPVSGAEWRMLAWYGWDIDQAQLVPEAERAAVLMALARACPPAEADAGTRLLLKALAEGDDTPGLRIDAAQRERVRAVLADARASRAQMDVLVNQAAELARALAPEPGPARQATVAALRTALQRLEADASLSRADRMSALGAQLELARIDQPREAAAPRIEPALLQRVRTLAQQTDQTLPAGHERQALISGVAHLLGRAGLWAESDTLLKDNLPKAATPYYLMSQLAGNARRQGRTAEALQWQQQAWEKSSGAATRLQWGAGYVAALVDLAPDDSARIERAAAAVLAEAGQDAAAFHERSGRSLERVANKLQAWNADGRRDAVLARLRAGLAPVCAKADAADGQRQRCEALFKPAPAAGGPGA